MGAIRDSFYDVGLALSRLKPHAVVQALGYRTFEELCAAEVELSVTTCDALVKLGGRVRVRSAGWLRRRLSQDGSGHPRTMTA